VDINKRFKFIKYVSGISRVGIAATLALVVLTAWAIRVAIDRPAVWKLLVIVWTAFFAMALATPLGARSADAESPASLVWGYGLASGAMVTSAAVFLVPGAIVESHVRAGGFGIAAGILTGYAAHVVGHRIGHRETFDHTAVALTAHAVSAGTIIGVVYGNLPELGPLLGLAIVSHKGPAGYAAARRLASAGKPVSVLLVPASGVGVAALPASLVALPTGPAANAVVFGFAAGVFLHVGMDFLPECEVGGEIHSMAGLDGMAHHQLDRLRLHAVGATLLGGVAVLLAWIAVS
jgi:ZIP family zinc transporter